jgi:hypothetical protein
LFFGPYVARTDLFYDDASQHIFWLYRYADPELFPNDLSVAYFMTSAYWGYRALYATIAPLADALQASEWIAVLLLAASAFFVWRSAAKSANGTVTYALLAVLALTVLLPLSSQRDFLPATAFQRAFALPLLLMTLWALVSGRYIWVGVSWLAAAAIYPVVLPVQGLTAIAVFARDLITTRRMPASWLANALLGVAALASAAIGVTVPPEIGPAYTYEQAMRLPEFSADGRLPIDPPGILTWVRGTSLGLGWRPNVLLLMAAGFGTAWFFGRLRLIPFAAWAMAAAGVGLWAAMRLFPEALMFGLYLPNRHSRWAIGIFGIFAIAAGTAAAFERASRLLRRHEPSLLDRWIVIGAPMVGIAVLLPSGIRTWTYPVDVDLENTYAFIATLPKDTLVAAHPDLADYVPLRAHRSVLTSTEISMAWMQNYYAVMKPRVEASLRAAYAVNIEEVDAALVPFGVDVMLSGPPAWQRDRYFAPFNELTQALLMRGDRAGFVLQHPPEERVLFKSGDYYVVRVGACHGTC